MINITPGDSEEVQYVKFLGSNFDECLDQKKHCMDVGAKMNCKDYFIGNL